MAHHLAELIDAVDRDPSDEIARKQCVKTVLEIWAYKSSLPNGARPFEDIEPVIRAIEKLDPESPSSFYMPSLNFDGDADDPAENSWISLAHAIDRAARVIINQCLERAVTELSDGAPGWAEIAEKAQRDLGICEPILLLTRGEDDKNDEAKRKRQKERLEAQIAQLELVLSTVAPLKQQLQGMLDEIEV